MNIKIFISADLEQILTKLNTKASNLLLHLSKNGIDKSVLLPDFGNYIAFSKEDKKKLAFSRTTDIIKYSELEESVVISSTFTAESSKYDFWKKRRNSISPGRIFSRILSQEYLKSLLSDSDIEQFSNKFVAEMDNQLEFELVKGEEIRKYYLRNTYSDKHGTSGNPLWQSCMNSDSTQKFLDIYVQNPDKVSLLVVKHAHGVLGRAIVWDDVNLYNPRETIKGQEPKKIVFMDRCYFTLEWVMDKMLNFAKERGWYARAYQKVQDFQVLLTPNGQVENGLMDINLTNLRHEFFPYMDTFHLIDYRKNKLSNANSLLPDSENGDKQLRQTGGSPAYVWDYINMSWVRKSDCVWIKNKLTYFNKSNTIFSDKSKDFFLKAECLYSKLDNEYITPDEETASCAVTKETYRKSRMVFSNYLNGLIHKKESINTKDEGIVHKSNVVYSKTLKTSFVDKNVVRVESLDDFLPKSIFEKIDEKQLITVLEILKPYTPEKPEVTNTYESYVFEF